MNSTFDKTLAGKTVIVTAGNQGGGAAIALRFADAGANVAIIANKNSFVNNSPVDTISDKIIATEACQHHLLFSLSKYGMSFCTLGMSREFAQHGIAFNSLWQERPIATPTLIANFSDKIVKGSNKPEVYAEAAYLIALKPAKEFTGNFCIDEAVLREAGVDPTQYGVDPTAKPVEL